MGHLPDLVYDLAIILMTGAATTLIFRRIKQPLVLGYIIAGFIVGPYFKLFPTIADTHNIETLAEIGVIILLFSLGLEFSFKKLMKVGGEASITAFVEIGFITVSGYLVGKWMGWSTMDSLFLGGMLASSSTTIIIRAFDELGVKTKQYARIVFGVLVVEDIVVILLMVLLSTIAVTKQFAGGEIVFTILKLVSFLAIWFTAGIFILPTLLKRAKALLNDETLLILSLGLCLGMVVFATKVGFSAELGAFIMGSIIAETTSAEKVEHLVKPIKDLFGSVFFVSVGMMIDPETIIEYSIPVLIVIVLTLFGKLFSTTLGALVSGQSLKQSVQVGMSMAQIGEFAFIVATLGLSLGVISEFLFPIAVGASAITTFTTPYMIKFSEPTYHLLERILPSKLVNRLNRYSLRMQNIQAESEWKGLVKSYIRIVLINGIIVISLMLIALNFLLPSLQESIGSIQMANALTALISFSFAFPFLWAMMAKKPNHHAYRELWLERKYNRGPLFMIEVSRILVGILLVAFWVFKLFSTQLAIWIVTPAVGIVVLVFARKIQAFYQRLEGKFLSNLNERETEEYNTVTANVSRKKAAIESELLPWDAHIVQLEVSPLAQFIGKPLWQLMWREQYGVNIVYIRRGDKVIQVPDRSSILLPFDMVGIIATDQQITAFQPLFETTERIDNDLVTSIDAVGLEKIVVNEFTKLKGIDIRSSRLREKVNGLVIGIERNNERILNPDSSMIFEWDDIVWLVGETEKIRSFRESGLL